jgi:chromate reductase, NAD(P)H dehydrogenase (quinone)
VTVEIGSIRDVPLYDGDLEKAQGLPPAVQRLQAQLQAADGVLLVTPEYNNGIPGVFKNAIDWMSRGPGLKMWAEKPVAVIGASPGGFGTTMAQAHWLPVLRTLRAAHWSGGRLMVSRAGDLFDGEGNLTDAPAAKGSPTSCGASPRPCDPGAPPGRRGGALREVVPCWNTPHVKPRAALSQDGPEGRRRRREGSGRAREQRDLGPAQVGRRHVFQHRACPEQYRAPNDAWMQQYLPFSVTGGALLFHLLSKLYERTSVAIGPDAADAGDGALAKRDGDGGVVQVLGGPDARAAAFAAALAGGSGPLAKVGRPDDVAADPHPAVEPRDDGTFGRRGDTQAIEA